MNVLLVDTKVKDYELFVSSVNKNTLAIVYSSDTKKTELIEKLPVSIERMGIVFHTSGMNLFLENELLPNTRL